MILQRKNIDIQTINEYKKLKEGLWVHGLSIEELHTLLSILKTIREIGYEPQKIVRELQKIKSLRQTERQFSHICKVLESRAHRFREVLPMCEQVMRLGIGFPGLLAYQTAVVNKAAMDKLPREAAAYRVMEDIEDYNKLTGMKKQLNNISMQIFMMNQFSARLNNAIMALFKLQLQGVTEDQILNACRFLENGPEMASTNIQ